MNSVLTILKKELTRIFTDKRMLSTLILPGILIFVLYTLMGSFIGDSMTANKEYNYNVYIYNQAESLSEFNESDEYKITTHFDEIDVKNAKQLLQDKKIDLIIVFEEDFDNKTLTEFKPNVSIYYNSVSSESTQIYSYYSSSLSAISINSINYNYFINSGNEKYDLATEEDTSAMFITMLVPFLLTLLLFSGCMSVTTESIAGEKERGTIATLLVTPTKRTYIAVGKVLALAIASLVSSLSSFIGLILSLPNLLGDGQEITLDMYGFTTYFEILILMILSVIFFTIILSIVSTFAKSVKEASQYSLPVMIIVMMFGITSMLGSSSSQWYLYLIPVYNIVQCMSNIFSLSLSVVPFIVTILSNIAYIAVGIYALTQMFNSEKIMFNK